MKKQTIILSILLISMSLIYSQDVTTSELPKTKKGTLIMPQQGDWGLGLDASPFFSFIGNMLKISDEANIPPAVNFSAQNPGSVHFKHYTSDTKAYRAIVKIGISMDSDFEGNGTGVEIDEKHFQKAVNMGFLAGIEKSRPIKNRIKGYYGFQAGFNYEPYFGRSYTNAGEYIIGTYEYKDIIIESNNFSEKGGATSSIIAGGLIGFEFFIAPKMSLGSEFFLDMSYNHTGKRVYLPEDTSNDVIIDMGGNEFSIANYSAGNINLIVYF